MPSFLHIPTGRIVHSSNPRQSSRYSRSSNFSPLPPTRASESHEDAPDSPAPPPDTLDTSDSGKAFAAISPQSVPDGTVADILTWAGTDPQRRAAALEHERAGKNRITLIRKLKQ